MTVSLLLADDHRVVRRGLRLLFEAQPDFVVRGEADNGLEAVQLAERFKPDVLIVDLMMPGINGLEVARQVRERVPQTRVVILSMHANEAYVLEAMRTGAAAYVLKEATAEELMHAVREVLAGRRYLSSPFSEHAIEAYMQKTQGDNVPFDSYETLTTREREVLQLAAEGHSNNEIAKRLSISPRTAEAHRTNLMRKLSIHSQAELIHYALQRGIMSIE